ncbi:hypothetical protein EYF80_022996 [Liparis tanakae]|uniref:Uncharacterized protein n=1 Tax=Liparis tanakae TaxID=230148 RepID=A0A4Z2HP62_9TELE|nr:hypothetical protein EYF80_022996 [Liparis tanakae]
MVATFRLMPLSHRGRNVTQPGVCCSSRYTGTAGGAQTGCFGPSVASAEGLIVEWWMCLSKLPQPGRRQKANFKCNSIIFHACKQIQELHDSESLQCVALPFSLRSADIQGCLSLSNKINCSAIFTLNVSAGDGQRGPERSRAVQSGPERSRGVQRGPERSREVQRGPERSTSVHSAPFLARPREV